MDSSVYVSKAARRGHNSKNELMLSSRVEAKVTREEVLGVRSSGMHKTKKSGQRQEAKS